MADNLNSLEQLEREIADYRSKFQQSSEVIDDLAQIQFDFEDVASEYLKLNNEHQALSKYINQSKAEFTTLQVESRNNIDEIIRTQENFHRTFSNFENTATENINQKLEILNQQFEVLKNATEQRLETNINEARQALNSLQAQSTDAVFQITQTQEDFNQRFVSLESTNLERIQETQEGLKQHFKTLETTAESKWEQFQQQTNSEINIFEENVEQRFAELTEDIDIRLEERLKDAKQALDLLQSQSSDAVNQITQTQQDFNQRFENLESNNLEQIQQTQESLNQRFTTFETTIETKFNQYQQQISSDISKLEQNNQNLNTKISQQLLELNKTIKRTQQLTFGAIAIGTIALIFAIFPLLSKTTNEVKSRHLETPQISNQNNL
jgi:predicted  nucleic acid-binding Zn-ribbon protein